MAAKNKTRVVFFWHMHQPYYRRADARDYELPWTRLHAVKDYYPFVAFLAQFKRTQAVVNYSPVCLDQVLDYAQGKRSDYYYLLSKKKPESLSGDEKAFILERFFDVNQQQMLSPYKRYTLLQAKRQVAVSPDEFSNEDIRDLQVLFNLVWFHFITVESDPRLQKLFEKANQESAGIFTEVDKQYVLRRQIEVMKEIVPLHRRLASAGKIELTASPYYHCILPLIYDTNVLFNYPYLERPSERFSSPSEAYWQIAEGKKRVEEITGQKLKGSWPAEGSVSEEVLALYKRAGYSYVVTDQDILARTLFDNDYERFLRNHHLLYQPYVINGMTVFFRDRDLANLISFDYMKWEDPKEAANDLLEHIRKRAVEAQRFIERPVIVIAMDGENAWEYYRNNGREFLSSVYEGIERDPKLETSVLSKVMSSAVTLDKRLWPGSWINADFHVWAGSGNKNRNLTLLALIKEKIDKLPEGKLRDKAVALLRVIEGSDWNWWHTFADPRSSFDGIFLSYIRELSRLLKTDFLAELNNH
jgi:alpha-amylase/alpha-mannosidase (GH57 family)